MVRRVLLLLLLVILAGVVVSLTLWFHPILVHASQETGTSNSTSRAYDFWSGFGSDLGELTLLAGVIAAYRHHNCHVKGCARLGKPVDGTPYLACPKHHIDHEGAKRGVSVETINAAHEAAQ